MRIQALALFLLVVSGAPHAWAQAAPASAPDERPLTLAQAIERYEQSKHESID